MKLLLVIDSLGSGGAQRQFALLAGQLTARGHAITAYSYYPRHNFFRAQLAYSGVTLIDGAKRGRFDPRPALALAHILRRGDYDAAVAFLRAPSLYLLAAKILAAARLPVVVSERSSSRTGAMPAILHAFALADAVVPNSHLAGQQIARAFPGLVRKIHVIPNGVNLAHFPQAPAAEDGGHPFRLLVTARMGPEKNALTVIEALAKLKARGQVLPHITWVGADDPSVAGRAYASAVKARLTEEKLAGHWTRLPPSADIAGLLGQCDAALLASLYEGTPNFVCEALACGRPVIASEVGDIPSLLQSSGAGLLFPPLDSDALAGAMAKIQTLGAAALAGMGNAARNFAEAKLSADHYGAQWEALLKALLSPSHGEFQHRP